jgi:hypothetical protein
MTRVVVVVLVVWLAACPRAAPTPAPVLQNASAAPAAVDDSVPDWLLPDDACPADVAAAVEARGGEFVGVCDGDLAVCLRRCEDGEAIMCYAAAVRVQALGGAPRLEDALFLRACVLGNASACTNRAASIAYREPDRLDGDVCASRTFELACDRRDPWGCTMFGRDLAFGRGIAPDLHRALEVLPGACQFDAADPACIAARGLMEEIEAKLRAGP